jgi:hypothetical protein
VGVGIEIEGDEAVGNVKDSREKGVTDADAILLGTAPQRRTKNDTFLTNTNTNTSCPPIPTVG